MIYEVINPSDAVTIEADVPFVAGLATLLLGRGKYAAHGEDDSVALPLMLFGGESVVDDWLLDVGHDGDLSSAIEKHRAEIVACLRSAMVAKIGERRGLVAAMAAGGGDFAKARAAFNESRRSSMNDICGRALILAKHYEGEGS